MKLKLSDEGKRNLMTVPWRIFYGLVIVGGISLFLMLLGYGLPYTILGIPVLILASFQYSLGIKEVLANPPHKGVVTYWGERQTVKKKVDGKDIDVNVVESEGQYLTMNYWPFYIDIIPIKVEKVNVDDVLIKDIICKFSNAKGKLKAGGRLNGFFSYTFVPDPDRTLSYINSGKEEGVKAIVENRISEIVRQEGRDYTWEELQFSGDKLTAILIYKLCGEKPFKLIEDPTTGEWKKVEDPQKSGSFITKDPKDCTNKEIELFLEVVRQEMGNGDGYADIQDLGVTIRRANLERFELGADLKQAAEKLAREEQERRGEVYEIKTELEQARALFNAYEKAGTPKTLEDCVLEIRRRKAQREGKDVKTIELPGLAEGIKAVAELATAMKRGDSK